MTMNVLYVEDAAQDADLARRALARLTPQTQLEVVPSLAAAMERLAQQPTAAFDLVLADLALPDGSGLQLLAHIRLHNLPLAVVILTGSGDQDAAIAALRSGADDYLIKSDGYLVQLPATLARALARFQARTVRKAVPIRVLYAEHHPFDIDLTRRHLAQHTSHIALDVVSSAGEVLERLPQTAAQACVYDVVLLDFRLPGTDALELVKVLREERGLTLPIVLVTSQGNERIAAQALHLGVNDYLTKHEGYLFELSTTLEKVQHQAQLERERLDLRESNLRYNELVARIPVGVYRYRTLPDGGHRFDFVSPRFCALLGLGSAALLDDANAAIARVHGDDLAGFVQANEAARQTRQPFSWEGRFVIDSATRWMRLESSSTLLENGDVVWDGVQIDITERKEAQQIQQVRNAVLDQVIAARPLPLILEKIALELEAIQPQSRVSILLLDRDKNKLNVGAAPSLPDFFNAATEGFPVQVTAGSCGAAAYLGQTVIVEDIATHPNWAPYRTIAARAGLGACWSLPFKDDDGAVLGTFGIYHETPCAPLSADLALFAEFARIISLAVQKTRMEAERQLSEQRFRATFEQSNLLKGITASDGTLLAVNQAALNALGVPAADLIGLPIWQLPWWRDQPTQQARLQQAIARTMAGQTDTFEVEQPKADGSLMVIEYRSSPIQIGAQVQMLVAGISITERKRAEDALRQSAMVFGSTRDGIIITDLQGCILSTNPAFTEITGYSEAEVLGRNPRLLQSGRQDRDFYETLWAGVLTTGQWQGEIWNRRKNGEIYPQWLTISMVRDANGQPSAYVSVFSDISQIKRGEEKLERLAHYDALTQLPNRLLLFSRLAHGIELAHRNQKMLALLMLDLDHFKDVNDSFGHLAGDELLQQVAQRLNDRLREVDTICRLGGDEFTVLLEKISQPDDAARVANDIIAALSKPWHLSNGAEVHIGVSVGISLYPAHGQSAEELLQQADTSLYQAKAEGRGRFKFFTEEMTEAVRGRIELEMRLRRALDQNELRVYYQPQVDIASGRIVGAEALVRWLDPVEGLIQPIRFIHVAEETGLINPMGAWVLQETCRQGQRWLAAGLAPLRLAVNLSPHQFLHGDIRTIVAEALAQSGFPAAWLELELTESTLMEREAEAIEILGQLRALGVQLAIDDFGTGYSSLAYLKRFPLDILKIDKSFVDELSHDRDDQAIAATIIAMAHTLRLKTLAEGVETQDQLDFLRAQGCDMYQGYLTSPPLPAEKFEQFLRSHTARGQP
jgi:diguanylate cyclase (GGDEF)-like protein/PAS domain S-box-containing protein